MKGMWLYTILFHVVMVLHAVCASMPIIDGRALSGESIQIPSGNGQQVLIMGFDMKSAPLMRDWTIALTASPSVTIEWFQVAMIGGVPPFIDRMITNRMRSTVPSNSHHRFLPYFGKTESIVSVLTNNQPLNTKEMPVIVLIDNNRTIQFQIQGAATTRNVQRVQAAIQKNHTQGNK